ncbi:hypothetical protein D3C78_926100 [compost metagenome]
MKKENIKWLEVRPIIKFDLISDVHLDFWDIITSKTTGSWKSSKNIIRISFWSLEIMIII